ncbi:dihydrofolate reductase [Levilactobacillus paucivorans]|uniref:Dihydrofolate reductase n=1 Tax=Levilactobacillus paucivorans TaxID=616990 RepID=A0A0R2LLM8_9LACO|nr:dihydrofolate reductase family protein [Levilactobacillus paucivorans]KRO00288.1 dihydrofolate reductase [Levilactobacillus paucivorans]
MGRIQFYGAVSLDGFLATEDDRLDWLTGLIGLPANIGQETLSQMASAILGRVTYDTIQADMTEDLTLNPYNADIPGYVLTHQSRSDQGPLHFTDTPVVDLAQRLQAKGNVWIVGGQQILTPLLAANLVDDLYLQVAPTLLGRGKRLFGELAKPQTFELQAVHQYGPLAEMVYRRQN